MQLAEQPNHRDDLDMLLRAGRESRTCYALNALRLACVELGWSNDALR